MASNDFTIIWSPSFKKEIKKIFEHIAFRLKEPIIAKKIYREIIGSINSIYKTIPNTKIPKLSLYISLNCSVGSGFSPIPASIV